MRAIILAAGTGSRLAEASGGLPKPLVEVGGKALIEHQLEALADSGIGPVMVVVGYKAEEVKRVVGTRASYVENTDPAGTNSLYSFWLAREFVQGSVLISNCDLLYHPEILDRLLDVKGSALAYDSSFGWGREKMKVGLQDGCVKEMSKSLPYGRAAGENLGLICLHEAAAKALVAKADEMVKAGNLKGWLPEAVEATAQQVPIRGVDVAGFPWTEIDFPFDLEAARKRVWPAIERERWKRTARWHQTRWIALAVTILCVLYIAVAFGRRLERTDEDWDSVPLVDLPAVKLRSTADPNVSSRWWRVENGGIAHLEVEGPEELRIEVRPILADDAPAGSLFVTEVKLDGKSDDLDAFRAELDPDVQWKERAVGQRRRIKLDVPEGKHVVEVGKAAGKHPAFLLRIREPGKSEPGT